MANERPSPAEAAEAVGALLLKLGARDVLTGEEEQVLAESVNEIRSIGGGRMVVRSGVTLSECTLLFDGIIARYKDLSDGQRQIMEFHVAGDFVDLHSFLLKRLEHHVGTLTPVRVATFTHESIRSITESHPHLARLLWFSTLIDSAIHREKILTVGRRTAIARIAHMMCELKIRLGIVGLAEDNEFPLPLTQLDLADATGLTSVHVNRMLKKLRDEELMTFRNGRVVIHDWEQLCRVAEFDPAYLYLERRPR